MPFNGGGFSGGGFGRADGSGVGATPPAPGADPWNIATGVSQANGVKQYGDVWASNNCPPCNTAIQQLQAALGVTVDGKVGQSTANAVARVASVAQQRGMVAEALALASVGSSPELVAKRADWLLPIVQRVAAQANSVNNQTAPTVFPTVTGNGPTPLSPAAPQPGGWAPGAQASAMPAMFSRAALKAKLPYIIGAAILAVGGVAVYFIVTHPPNHEDS